METFEVIVDNEFVMSFTGMLVWFSVQYGSQSSKVSFSKWFAKNSGHIIVGLVVAFAIVAYDDEIVQGYNDLPMEDITWPKYYYLLGGIWLNLLYKIAANIGLLINLLSKKISIK